MTGFGEGYLFVNGIHVAYYNLEFGSCADPPGGVNTHGNNCEFAYNHDPLSALSSVEHVSHLLVRPS